MTVVCVCTGNTCRSPMAAALLQRALPDATVIGAGLSTVDGLPASPGAVTVMAERGVDLTGHRSRCMTPELATEADWFVAMTAAHRRVLEQRYGVPSCRIVIPADGIPDPYGGDESVYRRCRDALEAALPALLKELNDV